MDTSSTVNYPEAEGSTKAHPRAEELYLANKQNWEPKDAEQWSKLDPLLEGLAKAEIISEASENFLISTFEAWTRMPPTLRAQIWHEREIIGTLIQARAVFRDVIPHFLSIGVGRRNVPDRKLVGVISVEEEILPSDLRVLDEVLSPSLGVASRVFEDTAKVALIIEHRPAPALLGQVPSGNFFLGQPVPTPQSAPVLRSGDRLGSESPAGIREYGTLTCIVSDVGSDVPLLLSSGHVLLRERYSVMAHQTTPLRVGQVRAVDLTLDAALAELSSPYLCDYRIKSVDMVPAAPVLPFSDMPVQMHCAVSGYQTGYLNQVNVIPAAATSVGLIPPYTATIGCAQGDSGALLLTGRGSFPPFPQWQTHNMHSAYIESMTCSMLGMLKAGPSPGADPLIRPQGYFTPILQILEQFGIQPWTR